MADLGNALFIVVAGISLVFLSLLILMGVIAALSRLFPEANSKPEQAEPSSVSMSEAPHEGPALEQQDGDEEFVASVAAALALAQSKHEAAAQALLSEPAGDRGWRLYGRQRLLDSRRPRG